MTPILDIKPLLDLVRDGKAREAIPHLENLVDMMPGYTAAHAILAQAYTDEKRWEDAKNAWQNASFLMPNSPSVRKGFRFVLSQLASQKLAQASPSPDDVQPPITTSPADDENKTENIEENDTPILRVNPFSYPAEETEDTETQAVEEPARKDDENRETGEEPSSSDEPNDPQNPSTSSIKEHVNMPPVPPILAPYADKMKEVGRDEELDQLIQELESARIVPKPEYEHVDMPEMDTDIDDMVSETLARIHEGQKQYDRAAEMYEKLALLKPDRARDFEAKASELRSRAADDSDEVHEKRPDES